MDKKILLSKKLKSYSAIAGSMIAMGAEADAQIVYTDVNPDSTTTISGNSYFLDLDNDGTFDFDINLFVGTVSGYTSQRVAITAPGSNAVAGDTVGMYVYPFALNSGDTIQSTLQFNYGSGQSMASYFGPGYSYGNFLGQNNRYLGLSFYIGSQRHYGWARFDVTGTATQFTIKDYAYNTVADQYILAGEGAVGINEEPGLKDADIYSHNKSLYVRFMKDVPEGANVKVMNMLGQEVLKAVISEKYSVLSLADQKSGIYLVMLSCKEGSTSRKVSIR